MKADELIARAKHVPKPFTDEQMAELEVLIEHNNSAQPCDRVRAEDAIRELGITMSRDSFDRHVKTVFGRTFGGCR